MESVMEDVLEAMAREIHARANYGARRFYDAMTESGRDIYRAQARAALAASRPAAARRAPT